MKPVYTKFRKDEKGVAATEFALIAPVLVFLLLGIADYCLYMNTVIRLELATRGAAQYMLNGGNPDNIVEDIIIPSNLGVTAANADDVLVRQDVVCRCTDGTEISCDTSCGAGDYQRHFIEVELTVNFTAPFLPYVGVYQTMPLQSYVTLQSE
jgi:Flp pilus assembly protein TadG